MQVIKTMRARPNQLLHIETPLGIVNILAGLTNDRGQPVDSIMILPDAGVRRAGLANTRLVGKNSTRVLQ